jgi:toxin ParE1/3/4
VKIVWSPLALDRVNEIADYIAQDDVEATRAWLLDIFGAVDRLQNFPESGRIVPEVKRPHIREIIFIKLSHCL